MYRSPNSRTTPSRRRVELAAFAIGAAVLLAACGGAAASNADGDAQSDPAAAAPVPAADPAPATSFALFDGSTASFADFAGQPLVVNFWASWCPSCVAEMSAAFRPVQESLGPQVTFLGMNIQDQRDQALDLLAETGVGWVNAEDPDGALYAELGGLGMPFTILIDGEGGILDAHNGPLSESQLRNKLAEHFGI